MIRIQDVQRIVARHYGLEPGYMTSADRSRYYAHPRQVAMYLARELTGHSTTVIGHWFNRDHSTIVHGTQVVRKRVEENPALRNDLDKLRERLRA